MDQISKQVVDSTRFAINRVYQPARIERELLAQIFDLVEQGGRKNFAFGDAPQEPAIRVANAGLKGHFAPTIFGIDNPTQIVELEEVA